MAQDGTLAKISTIWFGEDITVVGIVVMGKLSTAHAVRGPLPA